MPIYFVRHGQSTTNLKGVIAGSRIDSALTDEGLEQAREVGKELINYNIDLIITSPLKRAQDTAKEIANVIGIEPSEIIIDERIVEYDVGTFTGLPHDSIDFSKIVYDEDSEDPSEFRSRVLSLLNKYKDSPQNVLLVSHAGVGRNIEAARQGLDPHNFYDTQRPANARVVKLDLSWLK